MSKLKLCKVINKETKEVVIGAEEQQEIFIKDGFSFQEVDVSYDNRFYLSGYAPEKPALTYEEVREMRQIRFSKEADPLRYDYDEALARGEENAEELKQKWLAKKDEIRADLPYPEE